MSDVYYDLYLDTNDGGNNDNKSKFSQIVSYFFKCVFAIIAIGVIGILGYRIITMQEPSMTDDFLVNETTKNAIEHHKNDTNPDKYDEYYVDFRTFDSVRLIRQRDSHILEIPAKDYGFKSFQVFTQRLVNYYVENEETGEYDLISRSEFYSVKDEDEGNFKISSPYYMPQSGQICITFRYNDNALKNLASTYSSAKDQSSPFVIVISDNKGNEYCSYSFTETKRANYYYQRMLFDGIDFSGVNTLYLDIYYKGDTKTSTPYRSMVIYDINLPLTEVDVNLNSGLTSGMKQESVTRK